MRLSEAIRLGAMLKPQAFGEYLVAGGTCALGAANEAVGNDASDDSAWPWSTPHRIALNCPRCGRVFVSENWALGLAVVHLNDTHRWTRERIADWVETIEAQQAAAAVDPQAGSTGTLSTRVEADVV